VADDLVRRGLLERAASVHDGRLSLVRLTDAGRDETTAIQKTFLQAVSEHFTDRLTAAQINAVAEVAQALGAPHC
jgi:DNA-binding MarR family transcriptional regulator